MAYIEFDFQTAQAQEQALEELHFRLEQLADGEYEETMYQLSRGWDSPGAEQFLQKSRRMQEMLKKTSEGLRMSVEALHEAEKNAERMEEKAKEIAEVRKYKSI